MRKMTTKKEKSARVVTHPRRQTGKNPGVHCVADSTHDAHGNTCWRHLAPWAWKSIDEGHTAITSALQRVVTEYECTHDVVRLGNELLQLAAELEELQAMAEAVSHG